MQMLYENPRTVVIYQNFGYQPRENVYIFNNKKVDINKRIIEDYPSFPDNISFTEEEKLQILPQNSCNPTLYMYDNPKQVLLDFATEIATVFNDASVLVAIAVTIAIMFFDLFISEKQGFPYVILYGDSNAGKSTILHMLTSIFGITNFTQLTSGTSTMPIIRAQLEKFTNMPVFFEELDKRRMDSIEDLGKDSFSATPRKKFSKEHKELVTEINTTFCAATNNFFEEMTFANFSRCIPVNMRIWQFDLSEFKYHSKDELKKLSCILPEILFYRKDILKFYDEQYKIVQKYCKYARICNNVAIGMSIWAVINDIVGKEIINTEELAKNYLSYFEQYLNTELLYGDIFLSDVYSLFNRKELIYGRDFLITKGKYLRINLTKYCDIYNSTHENKKLNPAQLRLKLANDKRVINLVATDMKPIGKAIKIDISSNEILLDIQNRITQVSTDKEADNEEDS